jgi:hypothetical protein
VPQSDWYKPLAHYVGNHHILFQFVLVIAIDFAFGVDGEIPVVVDWSTGMSEWVSMARPPAISRPSIGSTPLTSGRSRRSSKPYITQQACDIITFMFVRQPKCAAAKDTHISNALRPGGGRSARGDPTRRDALV